uniref:Uncharacterized protein n=1 Tax=Esox lucius TaxID=8010 RepID=A0A3P8YQ27_ESOLU
MTKGCFTTTTHGNKEQQGEKQRRESALVDLMNDNEIVIKPRNKGGAIVVQSEHKHRFEILSQLAISDFYKNLNGDPLQQFLKKVFSFLDTARQNGWISKTELDFFFFCQHPIRPVIYTLPKIHKRFFNVDIQGHGKLALLKEENSLLIFSPLILQNLISSKQFKKTRF